MGRTRLPAHVRRLLPPEHREPRQSRSSTGFDLKTLAQLRAEADKPPEQRDPSLAFEWPTSEAHFQDQVIELAKWFRWRHYHTWSSKHSPGGFPDLVLIRRPRIVWAELKTETGVVSDLQRLWLDDLEACGQESYLWRPSDWLEIERILR